MGGTFYPIDHGHRLTAEEALWMGSNVPPMTPRRLGRPTARFYGRPRRIPARRHGIPKGPEISASARRPEGLDEPLQVGEVLAVVRHPGLDEPLLGQRRELGQVAPFLEHPVPGGPQLAFHRR